MSGFQTSNVQIKSILKIINDIEESPYESATRKGFINTRVSEPGKKEANKALQEIKDHISNKNDSEINKDYINKRVQIIRDRTRVYAGASGDAGLVFNDRLIGIEAAVDRASLVADEKTREAIKRTVMPEKINQVQNDKELLEAREQIKKLQDELSKAQMEVEEFKGQLTTANVAASTAESLAAERAREGEKLRGQLATANGAVSTAESFADQKTKEAEKLREQLATLSREAEAARNEASGLRTETSQQKEQITRLENSLRERDVTITTLRSENGNLRSEVEQRSKENAALQQNNVKLSEENIEAKSEQQRLSTELLEQREQFTRINAAIDRESSQRQLLENTQQLERQKLELDILSAALNEEKSKTAGFKQGQESLSGDNNRLIAELQEIRSKLSEQEQQIRRKDSDLAASQNSISQLSKERDGLTAENSLLTGRLKTLEGTVKANDLASENLLQEQYLKVEQLTRQLEEQGERQKNLSSDNNRLAEELRKAQEQVATQGQQIRQKDDELAASRSNIAQLSQEKQDLTYRLSELQRTAADKASLTANSLQDKDSHIDQLTKQLQENANEVAALRSQIETLKTDQQKFTSSTGDQISSLQKDKKDLATQLDDMASTMEVLKANYQSQLEISMDRLKEINELKLANDQLKADYDVIVDDFKEQLISKDTTIQQLQERLKLAEKKLDVLERSKATQTDDSEPITPTSTPQSIPTIALTEDTSPKDVKSQTGSQIDTPSVGLLSNFGAKFAALSATTVGTIVDYGDPTVDTSKPSFKIEHVDAMLADVDLKVSTDSPLKPVGEPPDKIQFHGGMNDDKISAAVLILEGVSKSNKAEGKNIKVTMSDFEKEDLVNILQQLHENLNNKEDVHCVEIKYQGADRQLKDLIDNHNAIARRINNGESIKDIQPEQKTLMNEIASINSTSTATPLPRSQQHKHK